MKPAFALDLSPDGIRLLFRAEGGWTVVGDVALEDPGLGRRLAALRAEAERIAPGALATELVIPPCQILYADLPRPTGAPDADALGAAVAGLTPLAPDEIVFDWEADGDLIRVAIVDTVTLGEAEAFAAAHGFNPVAFGARPAPDQFPRAPDFGPTRRAAALAVPTAPEAAGETGAAEAAGELPGPEAEGAAERDEATVAPASQNDPDAIDAAPPAAPPSPEATAEVSGADGAEVAPGTEPVAGVSGVEPPAAVSEANPDAEVADAGPVAGTSTADGDPAPPETVAGPADDAPADTPDPTTAASDPAAVASETEETDGPIPTATVAPLPLPAPGVPLATAEALARSLSAPRPGRLTLSLPERSAEPKPARPSRALLAAGVAVLALAGAGWLGLGLLGDPAARLPDEPPAVAVTTPDLDAPAGLADLAEPEAPATGDPAPAASDVAAVAPPDASADPAADTDAPAAMADEDPAALLDAALPDGPALAAPPPTEGTEAIYFASIDPATRGSDAIALLSADSFAALPRPLPGLPPVPPGTTFDVGPDGLVVATPEGALTPDGIVVTLGAPPLRPPAAPARAAETDLTPSEVALAVPNVTPRARPADLVEQNERATLGGRTRAELAALRPEARPLSAQAEATAAAPAEPSDLAVAASLEPAERPADLATRFAAAAAVAAAMAEPPPEPEAPPAPEPEPVAVAAAPAPAPAPPPPPAEPEPEALPEDDGEPEVASVDPDIPTSASVARQATIRNAISLRDINLIGVYGTERDRRALVRLPSGRFVKVEVGDRLDGGQVAAIGRDELRYRKGGRNITLSVPSG